MLYGRRFHILFVCHANQCRSPMAEHLARRFIGTCFGPLGSAVTVSSAGTHAGDGHPMHPSAVQVLAERGIREGNWSSRALSPSMLAGADLVLTAGRPQRGACVELEPRVLRHTFTLRQLARIAATLPRTAPNADHAPEVKLRTLVGQVNRWRNTMQPVAGDRDDIVDPVTRPVPAFRECAQTIGHDLETIFTVAGRL
jgi:protein-tyrosine phosphatase